jgi:hypothetical protein
MLRTILAVTLFVVCCCIAAASGPVHVKAYTRKDGTHVQAHTRAAPGTGSGPPVYARISAPPIAPRTEARNEPRTVARAQEARPELRSNAARPNAKTRIQVKNAIIDVRSAGLARPRLVNGTKSKFASRKYFVIELVVSLDDPTKPLKFRTFAGPKVKLTDERGRVIKHVETDEEGYSPDGRNAEARDLSRANHADPLLFELPEDNAGDLTLVLDWDYFGESPVEMVIPAPMVK